MRAVGFKPAESYSITPEDYVADVRDNGVIVYTITSTCALIVNYGGGASDTEPLEPGDMVVVKVNADGSYSVQKL